MVRGDGYVKVLDFGLARLVPTGRQGKDNVEEIAMRIGYESGAAFSQAFKREIGVAPGHYRRAASPVDAR
jgi:AraC-like DNA-binding protein